MGGRGLLELGQGEVELTGLEEEVGEFDLGVGKRGVERDDLAEERQGLLLIAGEPVGQKHRLGIERVGMAPGLGDRVEVAVHQPVLGVGDVEG
jgi:hypothetical protein